MPSIASFVEAAKAALLAGDAAQAATVCRHVLAHYPKHIEANCLLAESLRDLGEIGPARELFLRVVSADPANLVAHWALGLIAESEGDLEWATWELARAWDSNPGYAELRGEILRVTGSRPVLTALALGQQYADAGLFDEAIAELRGALAAEPDRLDVAIALASVLWRDGQRDAAAEICAGVLADSPDCLKANVLLGIHLSDRAEPTAANGRANAQSERAPSDATLGRRLLARAAQLDPGGVKFAELFAAEDVALPEALKAAADLPALPGPAASIDETPWLEETGERPQTVQKVLESRLATAAASRPDADLQALESLDPSWQELLTEEITLDDESEARLSQALREAGLPAGDKLDEGWLEVSTAAADAGSPRTGRAGLGAPLPPPRVSKPPADEPTSPSARKREPSLDGAAALWRAGDTDAALAEYRLLLSERPDSAESVADGVQSLLEAHPECLDAHRVLGDAYMRTGRFQQAIDEYNLAMAKD